MGSGQEYGELVAAEARGDVARTTCIAQHGRDQRERIIATGVTMRIIDLLEVVHVDHQYRQRHTRLKRTLDLHPERLFPHPAIADRRHRILEGASLERIDADSHADA